MARTQATNPSPLKQNSSIINSLTRIRSQIPTLVASEARVATWVLRQPEKVMQLSMAQVAQACGVSDTTVLRFCRNVGFQGYLDLKLSIARDLTGPTQIIHDDIVEGDEPAAIARKVFLSNIQALYDTLEVLNGEALNQAVKRNTERFPPDFVFQLLPREIISGLELMMVS